MAHAAVVVAVDVGVAVADVGVVVVCKKCNGFLHVFFWESLGWKKNAFSCFPNLNTNRPVQ